MKKWIVPLMLSMFILTSCSPNQSQVDSAEEPISHIQQDEHLDRSSQLDDEEQDSADTLEDWEQEHEAAEAQEAVAQQPVYMEPPSETKFEALVLANGGATLYEEPDRQAKRIGSLPFGEHVFALLEADNWIYVSGEKLEGWVNQNEIREIPYASSTKIEITNPDDPLVLVNKTYVLPSDYKPADLVIPNIPFPFEGTPEKKMMQKEAALALEELFASLQAEGLELFGISGYRSFATQRTIFPNNVLRVGFETANSFSAFPGESEHQTGLAMDVSNRDVQFRLVEAFGDTAEGIWLKENAHRFGFIIRYPKGKERITGYTYEPWHLRYVGQEAAQVIADLDITLEEYIEQYRP